MKRAPHAILWRDRPGEHWECTCGRWRFDSPFSLSDAEAMEVVRGEWTEHLFFEERYG